jgi:hypothetical protein
MAHHTPATAETHQEPTTRPVLDPSIKVGLQTCPIVIQGIPKGKTTNLKTLVIDATQKTIRISYV